MPSFCEDGTVEYTLLADHHNLVHNLPFGICKRKKRYNPTLIISEKSNYVIVEKFYL
jgi:peroxiredoxin